MDELDLDNDVDLDAEVDWKVNFDASFFAILSPTNIGSSSSVLSSTRIVSSLISCLPFPFPFVVAGFDAALERVVVRVVAVRGILRERAADVAVA